jgi:hypothetical protein
MSMTTSNRSAALLTLATQALGSLTDTEQQLFQAVATGIVADFSADSEKSSDFTQVADWGEGRVLNAEHLIWLLTDPAAQPLLTFRGIRLKGALITGSFDLAYGTVTLPWHCQDCGFTDTLQLAQAKLRSLALINTHVPGIQAAGLQVDGDLVLQKGFTARGPVDLLGATITGRLDCRGGSFQATDGYALMVQDTQVGGAVLFSRGFRAEGRVSVSGSTIGGNLVCTQSHFHNPNGGALLARGVTVKGAVLLQNQQSQGQVNFAGATIASIFDGSDSQFTHPAPQEDALNLENATISGDVRLRHQFTATGGVNLSGATIAGSLLCSQGQFSSPSCPALLAYNTTITGTVFLDEGFTAQGAVSFYGATIGGNLECEGEFTHEDDDALIIKNVTVRGSIFLRKKFIARGRVNLRGADIGGNLTCKRGRFQNPDNDAITAESMAVQGSLLCRQVEAQGRINFLGSTIGGEFDFANSQLRNGSGPALIAINSQIAGNVTLARGFRAEGIVSLIGAKIKGNLNCCDGAFINPGGVALRAEGLDIEGDILLGEGQKAFTAQGKVNLADVKIDDTLSIANWVDASQGELDLRFVRTGVLTIQPLPHTWPHQLNLHGFTFSALDAQAPQDSTTWLQWLRRQPEFAPQPYEQVAQVLRASGHEDAATEVLIGKETDRRSDGGLGWWGKLANRFFGVAIAYGYYPERALAWALIPLTTGLIAFHWGYGQNLFAPVANLGAYDRGSPAAMTEDYPNFNAGLYALDTFVPLIDLHQQTYWLPDADKGNTVPLVSLKSGAVLRWYLWLHILLGWVLTSLWVAGFTGLVRSQD